MTAFELYFGTVLVRGTLSVLALCAAEKLLSRRLGTRFLRLLWFGCMMLMLIPPMNLDVSPVRLNLSAWHTEKGGPLCPNAALSARKLRRGLRALVRADAAAATRAVWRWSVRHRRMLETGLWLMLTLPALGWVLARYLVCRRMIRRLPPVRERRILTIWREILARCGALPRPLILLDSGDTGLGPTVFGCFLPKLLLPVRDLRALTDRELRLLLEHEYFHVCSGDMLVNMTSILLWTAAWYNPLQAIARRHLHRCCEMECDRQILELHPGAVRDYGKLLLKFVSYRPAVGIGLSESPCELALRIRRMTSPDGFAPLRGGRRSALVLAALLTAPVVLVAVNIGPAALPAAGLRTADPVCRSEIPEIFALEASGGWVIVCEPHRRLGLTMPDGGVRMLEARSRRYFILHPDGSGTFAAHPPKRKAVRPVGTAAEGLFRLPLADGAAVLAVLPQR